MWLMRVFNIDPTNCVAVSGLSSIVLQIAVALNPPNLAPIARRLKRTAESAS